MLIKILSIDDSKSVHAFLDTCIDKNVVSIFHAYDGKDGLNKAFSENFDLILLDWEMPVMTGPEVLQSIREKDKKTPVIMLTSKNEVDDIEKMLKIGANEYIMKPFTAEIISEKIKNIIGHEVGKK